MRRVAWLVSVCACGGGSSHPIDALNDAPDSAPDAATTFIVPGMGVDQAVTDNQGVENVPTDFSSATFASLAPDGAGFEHRSGIGTSSGMFSIPVRIGAPFWYLQVPYTSFPFYVVGQVTTVDLTHFTLGRPDATTTTLATPVTMNVTGLAAWQTTDDLELFSSNAGAYVQSPQNQFATKLAAGNTSISGQSFDWSSTGSNLVAAASGDTLALTQLATRSSAAGNYRALAKYGATSSFTVTGGAAATYTATLADAAPTEAVGVTWQRSQFAAQRALAGPGAVDDAAGQVLLVDTLPGALSRGIYGAAPDLVVFQPATGTTDLPAATFDYANPFGTDEYILVTYLFDVPVLAPGAVNPANLQTGVQLGMPVSSLPAGGALALPLSAPQHIEIAGMDASQPLAGLGNAPTVTWDPPATGSADGYQVQITSATNRLGSTQLQIVAKMYTTSTSLQIPGLLVAGTTYVVNVAAIYQNGITITTQPELGTVPYAAVEVATATFTP